METTTQARDSRHSLLENVTGLREDIRLLLRQEAQLAKTELSEKFSQFKRNTIYLAAGGLIALLALNLLLIGFGYLLALAFQNAGLSTGLALFLGFITLALVMGLTGFALVAVAIKTFSKESIMPEKTIETLKEIKEEGVGHTAVYRAPAPESDSRSEAIKTDIDNTRTRIGREMTRIRDSLKIANLTARVATQVKCHPLRSVGIGLGTGLAGFVLLRLRRLFGRKRMA